MPTEQGLIRTILLYDWQRRLTALLTLLLLYQYIAWVSAYWLELTLRVVELSLVAILLLEWLPGVKPYVRRLLQAAGLLAVTGYMTGYSPLWESSETAGFWGNVQANAALFTPYVWFSFIVWLAYLVLLWWVRQKWRIIFLGIFSVVLLAVVDSFSYFVLWDQVALIILCGLLLLVIHHFNGLKSKSPAGWRYLAEYPGSVVMPVTVIVSFIVVAGVLAPDVGPILKDPYTAWKNWKGEAVNTFGKGRGLDNFGFQSFGNSSSGYSRNDQFLGGGFDFDYSIVMTVDSTHRSYWRGETRSTYTGRGWDMSDGDRNAPVSPVPSYDAVLPKDAGFDDSRLVTVEVEQMVTMYADRSYPVLFGAFSPTGILNVDTGERRHLAPLMWAPRHAELRWDERRGEYPKVYTVISRVPVIDEAGLRGTPAEYAAKGAMGDYLQLPPSMPDRVGQLALDITRDHDNVYDKVKAIEAYLYTNYRYTNRPDLTVGRSRDFVDRFLFEMMEGYCDYYSTAMVVLVRSLGIPARWVKGYVSGVNEYEEYYGELTDLEDGGYYTVRNADAHSWPEVYFHGYGWIPFEPTSGFVLPSHQLADEGPVAPAAPLPPFEPPLEHTLLKVGQYSMKGAGYLLLALLLWYFLFRLQLVRRLKVLAGRYRNKAVTADQKVVLEFEKLLRYSRRKGFLRFEHETVRETISRWVAQNAWMKKDLEAFLSIFEKAKYSSAGVTDDDLRQVEQITAKLREEM